MVYKNRRRDTVLFSILDDEWPALKQAFEQWLAADNFDSQGQQICKLIDIINKNR